MPQITTGTPASTRAGRPAASSSVTWSVAVRRDRRPRSAAASALPCHDGLHDVGPAPPPPHGARTANSNNPAATTAKISANSTALPPAICWRWARTRRTWLRRMVGADLLHRAPRPGRRRGCRRGRRTWRDGAGPARTTRLGLCGRRPELRPTTGGLLDGLGVGLLAVGSRRRAGPGLGRRPGPGGRPAPDVRLVLRGPLLLRGVALGHGVEPNGRTSEEPSDAPTCIAMPAATLRSASGWSRTGGSTPRRAAAARASGESPGPSWPNRSTQASGTSASSSGTAPGTMSMPTIGSPTSALHRTSASIVSWWRRCWYCSVTIAPRRFQRRWPTMCTSAARARSRCGRSCRCCGRPSSRWRRGTDAGAGRGRRRSRPSASSGTGPRRCAGHPGQSSGSRRSSSGHGSGCGPRPPTHRGCSVERLRSASRASGRQSARRSPICRGPAQPGGRRRGQGGDRNVTARRGPPPR